MGPNVSGATPVNHPHPTEPTGPPKLSEANLGCALVLTFFLLLMAPCFVAAAFGGGIPPGLEGAVVGTGGGSDDSELGALPALSATKTSPTTSAVTAPTATAPPVAETSPPQSSGAAAPQTPQTQAPAPPPTAPPLPSCGFGNGISVSGGNPGTLGSGGGSFTVASIPVTISVSGVPPCGKHYRLEYSGGGAKGSYNGLSACTFDGPSVTINSQFMSVGDTVSVTLQIPPNSCGD